MSKVRELLKRWFSEFGRICCNKNLLIETKELLAKRQPLNLDISEFQRGYGAALTNAIYVKEPTREPLSDDEIDILWGNEKAIGLYSFARVIEKHHGITGADSE